MLYNVGIRTESSQATASEVLEETDYCHLLELAFRLGLNTKKALVMFVDHLWKSQDGSGTGWEWYLFESLTQIRSGEQCLAVVPQLFPTGIYRK